MTETIDLILALSMLISGLLITLIGFDIIKLKAKTGEEEERLIDWKNKFGKFAKFGGIALLIIGIFLIISPSLNNKPENWTQSQKEDMKKLVMKSSNFLKSINSDTAQLVVTCFVDKYTAKYTLKDSWKQDKMTQEEIIKLTMPIMKECLETYSVKTDK